MKQPIVCLWMMLIAVALLSACTVTDALDGSALQGATAGAVVAPGGGFGETTASAGTAEGAPQIALQRITSNPNRPVFLTHAGDGGGRLFVVEKDGTIRVFQDGALDPQPFLDITDRVGAQGSEQGLLGLAFHPDFERNGQLFVNYTDREGDTVVSRFSSDGTRVDAASEHVLLQIAQPYRNHNGGMLAFGPDGYLYIGVGDGGSAGDPENNAQRLDTLLGKILRIDVDSGDPYAIPPDNPWAGSAEALPEIWAYGLRNPWRFAFDRLTGDLYIADVGQNAFEEINMQPVGSDGGENYGWRITEGTSCYTGAECDATGLTAPVAQYSHDLGCSVTGGYVYRGGTLDLEGVYIFGDFCTGRIWGLQQQPDGAWSVEELLDSNLRISSFGEDEAGNLYVVSFGDNSIYQIVPPNE